MSKKQYQVTAIIYDRRGNILSIGQNSYVKTHPLQAKHATKVGKPAKVFLHAEIDAIVKCRDLSKAHKIVVYRYGSNQQPMNACPCEVCRSAIASTPIKVIEHT